MMTRAQVDAMVDALVALDMAKAGAYGTAPSTRQLVEVVPSLRLLRDMATALNKRTYKMGYLGVEFEGLDYGPVHFEARTGKVD